MNDFLGQPIEAGDLAVYVSSGRYTQRMAVKVVEVRKRVKLRALLGDGVTGDEFWADSSSIAVVGSFKSDMLSA